MRERRRDSRQKVLLIVSTIITVGISVWLVNYGHDQTIRLEWHRQFNKLFWSGEFYPRWLPDSFEGMGAPTFYFYPPLVFWIGALCTLSIPLPPEFSNIAVTIIGYLLSFYTIRLFAREFTTDEKILRLCSYLYILHPYRAIDVIVRSAVSEHFAFVFIPLALLTVIHTRDDSSVTLRKMVLGIIGWTGLILTHIPTFLIVCFGVVVYEICDLLIRKRVDLRLLCITAAVSLGLSAFYTLPAYRLTDQIMMGMLYLPATLRAVSSYVFIDLFTKYYAFAAAFVPIIGQLIYYLVQLIRSRRNLEVQSGASKVITVFLPVMIGWLLFEQIPYVNDVLIKKIPGYSLTQYSWRWLLWAPVITTLLTAMGRQPKTKRYLQDRYLIPLLSIALTLAVVFQHLVIRPHKPKTLVWKEAPEYMNTYMNRDPEEAYRTIRAHTNDPFVQTDSVLGNDESIRYSVKSSTSFTLTTSLHQAKKVTFHLQYFPLWSLTEGARRIATAPDSIGRLTAQVPAGTNTLTLQLNEPKITTTANVISLTSVGMFAIFLAARRGKHRS